MLFFFYGQIHFIPLAGNFSFCLCILRRQREFFPADAVRFGKSAKYTETTKEDGPKSVAGTHRLRLIPVLSH